MELINAGILGQKSGAHFIEAFLLFGGYFFGSFRLYYRISFDVHNFVTIGLSAAATSATSDYIDNWNDNRAALSLLK